MARGKSYSLEEKQQILREVEDTGNVLVVARKHNIPQSTIHSWIRSSNRSELRKREVSVRQLKKQLLDKDLEIKILKDLLKKTNQAWLKE